MHRKLASIQKIEAITPIPGADFIEHARVLGWSMIVKKGEFKPNDVCTFFEIDSMLPERPEFEFMRKHKFRVRSIKMKMTLAQGLALPVNLFSELVPPFTVGDDVTEKLGIVKYEHPEAVSTGGIAKGTFPFYIPKTDEMRIQSVPDLLEEMRGLECYITVKMDGTSATFSHRNGEMDVCGRNLSFKENEDNAMWKMQRKHGILEKLAAKGNFALQGEVCGPGIQANPAKLSAISFFAFNMYDIDKMKYLNAKEFFSFCVHNDIPTVPLLKQDFILNHSLEDLLKISEGNFNGTLEFGNGFYDGTEFPREGIVIRPVEERMSSVLRDRMSFKVINNAYLLKTGQ